ncbi:GNAT family N-acetyltransferase [Actinophytocola sp.]|uniref:GNAT family N-acetyltransferase n=1 Tax=Actinophytocola sp. TaxID=1872138 RepID=UPI0025C648D9|nr:GNAT family N-acetyltransferase [Actinophytocola sp.]
MTTPITIRPAVVGDARAVLDLHVRARSTYYRGFISDDELAEQSRREAADYERMIRATDRVVRCAETDRRLVGFLVVGGPHHAEPGVDSELFQIHVDPALFRRGVGTALHRAAVGTWREMAAGVVRLWVWEFNERAREFYRRNGWWHDGSHRPDDPRVERHRMIGLKLSVPPDTHST